MIQPHTEDPSLPPSAARARLLLALIVLLLVTPAFPVAASRPRAGETVPPAFVPGEVLLGWRPGVMSLPARQPSGRFDEDRADPAWQVAAGFLAAQTGLIVLDAHPGSAAARLRVTPGREAAESARLSALAWVAYAEPNYVAHAAGEFPDQGTVYPTDTYIGELWNMRRISAPQAWAVSLGSYSIILAVVDSGVDHGHPEFTGRLQPGYDYVNFDNDPQDDYGHGTHVAGIAAAAANNGQGVVGVAAQVKLLPLKVLDQNGYGSYGNIALAIEKAAEAGAQVINLSLGGTAISMRLQSAVNYALGRGALVVAASGNCAQGGSLCSNLVNPSFYPAASTGVLAVGAGDHYDNWAPYSGFKPYVGIAAPGGLPGDQIWSTNRNGSYGYLYGTSMATPLVSGAAALVWTMQPAATPSQVADILKSTADKTGTMPDSGQPLSYATGRNDYFGYGRLNVARAVQWAYPPSLQPSTGQQEFFLGDATSYQLRPHTIQNPSDQAVVWQATVQGGEGWLTVFPTLGNASRTVPGTFTLQAGPSALAPGTYQALVQVRAVFPVGLAGYDVPVQLHTGPNVSRHFVTGIQIARTTAAWIDPAGVGRLNLLDGGQIEISLPFPVAFYGQGQIQAWVSDNGLLYFGNKDTRAALDQPLCPASAAGPNNAIYALWQDWGFGDTGGVYVNQPDPDHFAVTWSHVRRAGNSATNSFQIVFVRNGPILLQYGELEAPLLGIIGSENFDGTVAEQVYCSGSGHAVSPGEAIRLNPARPW